MGDWDFIPPELRGNLGVIFMQPPSSEDKAWYARAVWAAVVHYSHAQETGRDWEEEVLGRRTSASMLPPLLVLLALQVRPGSACRRRACL